MIKVSEHAEGSILPVWAKPGAKKNAIVDEHDGALRVSVTAPPEGGKANEAIVEALAEGLSLRRSQIVLIAGAGARAKRFLVREIGPDDLLARIDAALTPTMFDSIDPEV